MANILYVGEGNGGNTVTRKYDGFSTTVLDSFSSANLFCAASDGTNSLWSRNVAGYHICKGTGFSNTISSSFASPADAQPAYDMHWDAANSKLYLAGDANKTYRMTGFSSTIDSSISFAGSPNNRNRSVTIDGSGNVMQSSIWQKVRKNSGFTTTITDSFTAPTTTAYSGVTWDGTNILIGYDTSPGKVSKMSGFSSTISSSITFAASHFSTGIDWQATAASGPANMKSYNTNVKSNIKSIDTNLIANIKSFDTNA